MKTLALLLILFSVSVYGMDSSDPSAFVGLTEIQYSVGAELGITNHSESGALKDDKVSENMVSLLKDTLCWVEAKETSRKRNPNNIYRGLYFRMDFPIGGFLNIGYRNFDLGGSEITIEDNSSIYAPVQWTKFTNKQSTLLNNFYISGGGSVYEKWGFNVSVGLELGNMISNYKKELVMAGKNNLGPFDSRYKSEVNTYTFWGAPFGSIEYKFTKNLALSFNFGYKFCLIDNFVFGISESEMPTILNMPKSGYLIMGFEKDNKNSIENLTGSMQSLKLSWIF